MLDVGTGNDIIRVQSERVRDAYIHSFDDDDKIYFLSNSTVTGRDVYKGYTFSTYANKTDVVATNRG